MVGGGRRFVVDEAQGEVKKNTRGPGHQGGLGRGGGAKYRRRSREGITLLGKLDRVPAVPAAGARVRSPLAIAVGARKLTSWRLARALAWGYAYAATGSAAGKEELDLLQTS